MDIDNALKNFERSGFKTFRFDSAEKLQEYLRKEIIGTTVGMGGSVSLTELKVYETLKENNTVYWHAIDRSAENFENAALAKVYILGVNAISETGEIVNIDGRGNRISGAIYGPRREKVIYICGTNKFEENLEKAIWRAKNIAAPLNAKRLGLSTPCAIHADKCYDCNSPQRICRSMSITTHPTSAESIIAVVNGKWGF